MIRKFFLYFLIALIIIGGSGYLWFRYITHKIFIPKHTMQLGNLKKIQTEKSVQNSFDNKLPITILLLGYGGGTHDGPYLTDSMMLVHIDPLQKKVFLVSIPRDIWIKIPTNGNDGSYSKINAAYAIGLDDNSFPNKLPQYKGQAGGSNLARYVVQQVTGISVDYFIGLDFNGFTHTIDTLGGVDITVETTFDDYEYPIEGKEDDPCGHSNTEIASYSAQLASPSASITELDVFPCRFEHLHFTAGNQHMNGETALKYVRSRHSLQDGTDFGRAKRQRNLLVAVKQKILSVGFLPKMIPFMTSLGDDARTDLTLGDVKAFIQNASTMSSYNIEAQAITDQNFLIDTFSDDAQSILESKAGIDNWNPVHTWLSDSFSGKPQSVQAVVQIENGTKTHGLAITASNKIKNMNLSILDPVNAPDTAENTTQITVYNKNIDPKTLDQLKNEFGNNLKTEVSSQSAYNVLIILGTDYAAKINKSIPSPAQ